MRRIRPKVSILMPNHNKGHHLGWAIQSVLNQTVSEIELIIVDDASDDDSLSLIEEFRKRDERIILRANASNMGPAASLNVGLRASSARVVAFLGSDDLFSKDRVERLLQTIDAGGREVVAYSDPISIRATSSTLESTPTNYSLRPSGRIFPQLISGRFAFHGAVTAVPRACFEKVGLFDESLWWGEDLEMCLRLSKAYDFSYDSIATYGYRRYEGNTIQRISREDRYRYQSKIIEKHLLARGNGLDGRSKRLALDVLLGCYVASGQWGKIIERGLSSRAGLVSLMTLPLRASSR